jgi:trehalose/maltose hydrolase-like predicted phosphorylase
VTQPLSPPPVRVWRPEYLPAYIGNGLLGLRCGRIPFRDGTTMANGFAGLGIEDGVEGFARVPFALGGDVSLDGVRLSMAPDHVRFVERRYDFSTAELSTTVTFSIGEATARIEVLQFCNHQLPTIVQQEIRVTVDQAADVVISVGIDPTGVDGSGEYPDRPSGKETDTEPDGVVLWHSQGDISTCGLAYWSQVLGTTEAQRASSSHDERGLVATAWTFRARADRAYRVRQMTSIVPNLANPHPIDQAGRMLALAIETGWDVLRERHRSAWSELWKGRIVIDGADRRWQAIADSSVFYLLTSVHPASLASTSLFGLAYWPNYHYYRGHVMWDIETFAVPPLLLLEPESARSILAYRSRHLEAAKINARLAGWKGAMYPWESCPLHGEEVTPGPSAPTKGHATIDVALAFAQFAHATGDRDYLRRVAWPVIQEVAQWIESRVERTRRGFELREMTGPAEAKPVRDNNAFVNMAARVLLDEAIGAAERLGEEPRGLWNEIRDRLVLPVASHGRYIPNHDDYRVDELKGGTPEAAAGIFPVGFRVPRAVEEATFRFAVQEQSPRYVGTAMLSSFLAYYAARAGLDKEAAELLERGYGDFIDEPFLETDEFTSAQPEQPRSGPMFANIGGFLTTLLYGYTGLRLGAGPPESWAERSVVLPPGWKGIHVERIWAHGEAHSLTAVAGAPTAVIDGRRLRRAS